MSNTGGNDGSSSNNNNNASSPSRPIRPTPIRPLAIVPWRNPIVMGRPGTSAFRPYNAGANQNPRPDHEPRPIAPRPEEPAPRPLTWPAPPTAPAGPSDTGGWPLLTWPAPPTAAGSSHVNIAGSMYQTGPGFYVGGVVVPVIGGSASVKGGGIRIGDTPKKRNRGEGSAAAAARNNPPPPQAGGGGDNQGVPAGPGGDGQFACSICGRVFASAKALFGHMRSHPDRGWKGAHPPPTFKAADEFANMPGVNRPDVAPEEGGGSAGTGGGNEDDAQEAQQPKEGGEGEGEGSKKGGGFDLNNPPEEK